MPRHGDAPSSGRVEYNQWHIEVYFILFFPSIFGRWIFAYDFAYDYPNDDIPIHNYTSVVLLFFKMSTLKKKIHYIT